MRKTYDFSQGKKNPYGIPYQTLINLYLRDCAANNRRLDITWKPDC